MATKIAVYATEQRNYHDEKSGVPVSVIRVAFKRSNKVWQIGSTVRRGDHAATSNIWLDPTIYDFVGSLAIAAKGPLNG